MNQLYLFYIDYFLDFLIRFSNNLLYHNLFIWESFRPKITYLQSLFSRYYLKTKYLVYKPSSYTVNSYSKNWLKSVLFFYIGSNISLLGRINFSDALSSSSKICD